MKKILTVLFAVALALSLTVFFAACGEKNENKGKENVITASLGKTEATVGEEVSVTYSATEGTVTVTYSKDGGAAVSFTGNTFTATEAGTYVFTFSAEGAENVTKTLTVKAAEPEPVVPVITATADKAEIYAGGSVTLTWSATEDAAVTVSYTKNGSAATALKPESGKALTIGEAGTYVFTFSADGAESKTVTVVVKAKPVITVEVSEAEITEGESVTFTFSCSDQAAVSVAVKYNGAAETLSVVSGTPVTLSKVGTYVFTFSAENAVDVEKTVTVRAHTHTYGEWTQVNAPTASSEGQIKRTCTFDGCESSETMPLPALTAENVAATATEGKYTYQETPSTCTVPGTGTYTFYIDTFKYTVDLPLAAHTYDDVTFEYSTLQGEITAYTNTLSCKGGCGMTLTVKRLPAFDQEAWGVQVTNEPTCGEDGLATLTYSYTAKDSSGQSVTIDIIVTNVTVSATGEHSYAGNYLDGEGNIYTVCSGCGDKLYYAALKDETLSVAFAENSGAYIGQDLTNDDFVVTATFVYTAEYDGHSTGEEFTVTNADEAFASYFANDLNAYDGTWLSEQTITYSLNAEDTVLAEGVLTFDVLPDFASAGIDAQILEMQSGTLTNKQIGVISGVEQTGLSVSFYLDKVTNADWSQIINNSGMIVGIPNLDPWNNVSGSFPTGINLFPNKEDTGNSQNLYNGGTAVCFNSGNCYVTITLGADGAVSFYKDGVLVVKYLATDTFEGSTTVQSFTQSLLSFITTSGFLFASQAETRDLIVTTALNDEAAWKLFTIVGKSYSDMTISLDGITIYTTYDGATAYNAMIGADTFEGVSLAQTGLAVSFNISEAMVYQTAEETQQNVASDWGSYTIKSGAFYITLPNLSAWDADGTFSQTNKYPQNYENGGNYQSYFGEACYVTISVNADGSIDFYKNGARVAFYSANESLNGGTGGEVPTVADFVSALFTQIGQSGFVFAEAVAPAQDLIVTGGLTTEQVAAVYAAQQAYRS